ncbi:MAG: 50S ribosomal protein L13 [Deltaproteobacteria bacterium]|nr:50S ribosomal protein L13 [Deltaproteobacteria bacterium]
MPTPKSKTLQLTKEEALEQRKWYVVDVSGKTLGRAASAIAHVLRGKHKPTFTPHVDSGDFVIVVNADKIKLTGKKLSDKIYYDHTLFPGGIKKTPAEKMLVRHPEELVKRAVWGMLPKGPLGRRIYKKLKVYAAPTHDHAAQQPETLTV